MSTGATGLGDGTPTTRGNREIVLVPLAAATDGSERTFVPPTQDPPAGAGGAGDAGDAPPEPSVPSRTVFTLMAVAGGILFLGFLVGAATTPESPLASLLVFVGMTMLVVVLVIGAAAATDLPPEARVVMGALAGLIVLLGAFGFFYVTQTPYAVCGALAAVPGVIALRAFTLLRDGFLMSPAGEPAPP